jgi:putative transposase
LWDNVFVSQAYRHKDIGKETSIFLLNYHIIFCPKRRRKILVGAVKERLEQLLRETCAEIDCEILALEILPDHLHLFVSTVPQMAPNQITARLKGKSSRILRQEFPFLLKMPSLWTRSSFFSTAGNEDFSAASETIKRYIESQTTRDA